MEKTSKTDNNILITVKDIEHLPTETEQHWYTIKAEFNDTLLGESSKVTLKEKGLLIFNTTFGLPCDSSKKVDLELLCNRPLIISVLKHTAKSKKQKDIRPVVVGFAVLECTPIVKGEVLDALELPLVWQEHARHLDPQPLIHLEITLEAPLLPKQELSKAKLLSVYVDSVKSVSDTMHTKETLDFMCTTPLYTTEEGDLPVIFLNGALKHPSDKDYTPAKRQWPNYTGGIEPSRFIPERVVEVSAGEEDYSEGGKLETEDMLKPKLMWNSEQKVILTSDLAAKLRNRIASHRVWPFEVLELKAPMSGKEKSFEHASYGYHGVAYVNLAPLLYPGVKKIRGAYRVVPYSQEDYEEKTKRPGTIAEDALRMGLKEKLWTAKSPTKKRVQTAERKGTARTGGEETERSKADTGRPKIQEALRTKDVKPPHSSEEVNLESHIVLEISLDRPLIPKRTIEELDQTIASYLKAREKLPSREETAAQAVSQYHKQVAEVARYILADFQSLFKDVIDEDKPPTDAESIAQMKQELFYSLNSTGKYFAYKQRLKFAIIKIVREKFFQSSLPNTQAELQAFLRDLFVYLQDELHVGLDKWFNTREIVPITERQCHDCETLGRFAREAESLGNIKLASKYYEERITREPNDVKHWIDFGTFHLGQKNLEEAEVCFHRALDINAVHVKTLLLYGLVSALLGCTREATDYLTAAVTHDPNNVLAWTTLGLYYETISDDLNAEMAHREAERAKATEEAAKHGTKETQPEDETSVQGDDTDGAPQHTEHNQTAGPPKQSPFLLATEFLLDHHVNSFVLPALGHELLLLSNLISAYKTKTQTESERGHSKVSTSSATTKDFRLNLSNCILPDWLKQRLIRYHLARARLCLTAEYSDYNKASDELVQVTELDPENVEAWCLLGHVHYGSGEIEPARACYERCLLLNTWPPKDAHLLRLRLGSMCMDLSQFQKAKDIFLDASRSSPTSRTWFGVGVACYRLHELENAEDALAEANFLNNRDPNIWAYLSLICLQTGRRTEAEQTYKYAIKMRLDDSTPLLDELHAVQAKVGFGNPLVKWENEVEFKP